MEIGVFCVTNKIVNFINLIIIGFGLSISSWALGATHEPLTMDQGFKFAAKVKDKQTVIAQWQIAPGHFLYRKHLQISAESSNIKLGKPLYPQGVIKNEPGFGSFEVYQEKVNIPIPILKAKGNKVTLAVHYQGCSEEGYCYPPTEKKVTLDLTQPDPSIKNLTQPIGKTFDVATTLPDIKDLSAPSSAQDKVSKVLSSGHFFTTIITFLGFGVLLAFTPCVLPMLPILSGIIVGQRREHLTTLKAFSLSLIYVISMSLTYAIAGILIGYAGGSIQAIFQKPWLLTSFSLMFVALALSFFGLYELKLPQFLQSFLSKVSNNQRNGSYLGVAIMGCLATLIVSPCVTPALVGALGYIGKTGNAALGGTALFALGLGMGIPLLLICTAGSKLLPKAGIWMDRVKYVFGIILLAMAIWIIDRILPGPITLTLWAGLLIFAASAMGLFSAPNQKIASRFNHGLSAIFFIYGVILLIGAAMGHNNPLQPLYIPKALIANAQNENVTTHFKSVADEKEVNNAINDAKGKNKIVMLDFYAKWCISCKLMENNTFNHPEVVKALENFVTLKADVTENDKIAKNLEQKFQVIAPPTFLFFDATGKELEKYRIVGEMGPKEFLAHLNTVIKTISKELSSSTDEPLQIYKYRLQRKHLS